MWIASLRVHVIVVGVFIFRFLSIVFTFSFDRERRCHLNYISKKRTTTREDCLSWFPFERSWCKRQRHRGGPHRHRKKIKYKRNLWEKSLLRISSYTLVCNMKNTDDRNDVNDSCCFTKSPAPSSDAKAPYLQKKNSLGSIRECHLPSSVNCQQLSLSCIGHVNGGKTNFKKSLKKDHSRDRHQINQWPSKEIHTNNYYVYMPKRNNNNKVNCRYVYDITRWPRKPTNVK